MGSQGQEESRALHSVDSPVQRLAGSVRAPWEECSEMCVAKMKEERKMRRWERNEEFSEAAVAVELFPELNIDPKP